MSMEMHRFLASSAIGPFSTENPQKRVVNIITMFFSVIALLCSVTILLLIKRLKVWNPQTSLIWWMSLCQCTYDMSFFVYISQTDKTSVWYYASAFFQLFGGVSVTLFTNVITAVLMYVIWTRKNLDLFRYYHWVLSFTLGPALAIGVSYLVNRSNFAYLDATLSPVYYWVRLGSILLNAVIYFITQAEVNSMTSSNAQKKRSAAEIAITTLTRRSRCYWIVQGISRSGAAVYEGVYGFHGFPGFCNMNEYVGAIFFAVLTPSASIGYLAIFLFMQPRAYDNLIEMLFIDLPAVFGQGVGASTRTKSEGSSSINGRFKDSKTLTGVNNTEAIKACFNDDASMCDETCINGDDSYNSTAASVGPGAGPGPNSTSPLSRLPPLEESGITVSGDYNAEGSRSSNSSIVESDRMESGRSEPKISGSLAGVDPSLSFYTARSTDHSQGSAHNSGLAEPFVSNTTSTGSWVSTFINQLGSDKVATLVGQGSVKRDDNENSLTSNSLTTIRGGWGSEASSGQGQGQGMRRNFGNNSLLDMNDLEDDELFDILSKSSFSHSSKASSASASDKVSQLTEFNITSHKDSLQTRGGSGGEHGGVGCSSNVGRISEVSNPLTGRNTNQLYPFGSSSTPDVFLRQSYGANSYTYEDPQQEVQEEGYDHKPYSNEVLYLDRDLDSRNNSMSSDMPPSI